MKTTIETINGKLCTVIWHEDLNDPAINDMIEMAQETHHTLKSWRSYKDGYVWMICNGAIAAALPALPLHPKPDMSDAEVEALKRLIAAHYSADINVEYLYADHTGECYDLSVEEGLSSFRWALDKNFDVYFNRATHKGERVKIAIKSANDIDVVSKPQVIDD